MIFFALLSLISALIVFFLGTFVYAKDTRNPLNKIFMGFCFSFTLIGIAEYGMRQAQTYEIAHFWSKFALLLIIPISFLFHFSLTFSNRVEPNNKAILFLIYLPMLFFISIILTYSILDKPPILKYWGWSYGPNKLSLLLVIYYLWEQSLVILSFLLLFFTFLSAKDRLKKKQAKLILIGFLIALVIYLVFDYFNVNFFGYDLPEFGIVGFTISSVFIAYAIRKYHLFKLNMYAASDNILKTLPDSLILTKINGKVIATNEITLKLLNYTKDEILNKNIYHIISQGSKDLKLISKILNQEDKEYYDIKDIEVKYLTKYEILIPMSLSVSIIKDPFFKESKGIIFIARDIAKRKEVEKKHRNLLKKQQKYIDEILKNSKFKTTFISMMSHELRTPLNSIIGFSDLLLNRSYGDLNEDQIEFLNDIQSSSEHLLDLINDLLDISKIEGGNLEIHKERINLHELIKEIQNQIKPLSNNKNLAISFEGFNSGQIINADPVRLKEIFYNLLTNAIKYTNSGEVKIKMKEDKEFWRFSIMDTGIGIAKDDFDSIFQEFDRTDNPLIKKTTGTGLGLPLIKRLIKLHGGKIWFESKLGEGTVFFFIIPKKSNEKDSI